jgi:hypothetical protein
MTEKTNGVLKKGNKLEEGAEEVAFDSLVVVEAWFIMPINQLIDRCDQQQKNKKIMRSERCLYVRKNWF